MNGAEALIETLVRSDVDLCLANPGTSEMQLVSAIDRVPGMRPVLALFEGVVTGAADGYARLRGKPACTLLHLGPGLANGVANIHNAQKAFAPMINVVGDHATYHRQYDTPLNADLEGIARPVSHWLEAGRTPATLAALGAEAVVQAGRVPGRIATLIAPADAAWSPLPGDYAPPPLPAQRPLPRIAEATIEEVARAIRAARQPMLLLGGQALLGDALLDAGRIAAHAGVRLHAETFNRRVQRGAGRVPLVFLPYRGELALELMGGVDLMVLVGARSPCAFFAYPNKPSELVPPGCRVLTLATPTDDVAAALAGLCAALDATRAELPRQAATIPALEPGLLDTRRIAQAVARNLPDDAIVVDEAITGSLPLQQLTQGARPHDWLQLCGGSIGNGLPLAAGAALGAPGRKVVCLEGDGSAMYTAQALWTMARESLDVVTVIYANRNYAILNYELERVGAGEPGERARSMLNIGRPDLDWRDLARGMGVPGTRVDTAEALDAALARAVATPGPHLIEAVY